MTRDDFKIDLTITKTKAWSENWHQAQMLNSNPIMHQIRLRLCVQASHSISLTWMSIYNQINEKTENEDER
jgi:hypothetical protein